MDLTVSEDGNPKATYTTNTVHHMPQCVIEPYISYVDTKADEAGDILIHSFEVMADANKWCTDVSSTVAVSHVENDKTWTSSSHDGA